jgi:hypothetical protein
LWSRECRSGKRDRKNVGFCVVRSIDDAGGGRV